MGVVLFVALFAGIAAGMVVSSGLCVAAFLWAKRRARRRGRSWNGTTVLTTGLVALAAVFLIVHFFPLPDARPGSDYDVAFRNLLLRGLGYGAGPGVAAVITAGVLRIVSPGDPS